MIHPDVSTLIYLIVDTLVYWPCPNESGVLG